MAEAKKTTKKSVTKTATSKKVVTKPKTVKKTTEKVVKTAKVIKEEKHGIDQKSAETANQTDHKDTAEAVVAKAGKRSAKAVAEAEEKQAKVERLAKSAEVEDEGGKSVKASIQQKPARSKLERRSKAYKKASELIDKTKAYDLKEALNLAIKTSSVKFDATVELHVNLNVDPRQADQNIRGTVKLPAGTGKSARVAVFGESEDVAKAKKAGADIAAGDEFLQQLDAGTINFDILIASPKVMAKLGKYAKVLGPKGLMPNLKSGTVTTDVAKAVQDAKGGRVEYRVDSTGIIHVGVGKVSFGTDKLVSNAQAVIDAVKSAKPASIKGVFVTSAFATTTMGPSIKLSL